MSDWKQYVQLLSKQVLTQLETELFNIGFCDIQYMYESNYHLYLKAYCSLQQINTGLKISRETLQKAEQIHREWEVVYGSNKKNIFEKCQKNYVNQIYNVHYITSIKCCVVVQELFSYTLEQEIQMLRQKNEWFSIEQMCQIIIQLCIGLTQIHQQKLIHCDIKPENVVKTLDGNYKLANLGFSKLNQKYQEYKIYYLAFSQNYISPEISYKIEKDQSIKITHKTDIYSLCLVILEVLNFNLSKFNALNILLNDFQQSSTFSNSSIEECQKSFEFDDVYDLFCKKCFNQDPHKRCDSYEILLNLLPLLPLTINNQIFLQNYVSNQLREDPYQNANNISYALHNKLYNSLILIFLSEQQDIQAHGKMNLYQNSAKNYLEVGQLSESLDLFLKALDIAEQESTERQEQAQILEQISLVYNRQGNYELGYQYAQSSLNLIQSIYNNSNHELIAQSLHRMSTSYQLLNNSEKSFYYAEKALQMRQIIYGKAKNEQLADSLDQMSNSYYLTGDFNSALQFCIQSLEIIQQIYKSPHPKIQLSLNNLACIYYQQNNFESSAKFFYQGLEMALQLYGFFHPLVQKITENFVYVLNLLKDQQQIDKYKNDLIRIQNAFDLENF
ncbi:kinase domain protein (macronuclear) [Tetrahymena thermophila SB210]|uniref:Kinase domain protein n=1 Tax=Tetrahymena thermophila (strain SB210) TaxID=312017 RepID=Q247X8_TETTS|nr:kinase domain protein [Tetrahymena thermophila SB210]EAS04167.2 kinase domain protein [Tetrahymena thermophila SB210]|eukprot:XP_001024412.2 kinase domain protein [Tetrahymena thermophila SB210]